MKNKYLAYIALLAGWLIFCYWLYSKEIYPQLHAPREAPWAIIDDNLEMPLTFAWGSEIPTIGPNYEKWSETLKRLDSAGYIIILRSYFFRDEAGSVENGKRLGLKRVKMIIGQLELSNDRVMIEVIPTNVTADVRSHPIESIKYEGIESNKILSLMTDAMELCFPLKDSFQLPASIYDEFVNWVEVHNEKKEGITYLTGTADGTGISESSEMGWDRALSVKRELISYGWTGDKIQISTEQRNNLESIQNRCVMIYFE